MQVQAKRCSHANVASMIGHATPMDLNKVVLKRDTRFLAMTAMESRSSRKVKALLCNPHT